MSDGDRARIHASAAADAAGSAKDRAQDAAARVEQHPAASWVEGIGQVANGIVHMIIGGIALGIAFGAGGSADQSGAMRALQQTPLGAVALWAVGIALAALAVHAAVSALAASRRGWKEAVRPGGRAIAYAAISATAFAFATGGSSDSEQGADSFSAQLFATPFGPWLVGLVGLGIAAIGLGFVVKGARRDFREDVAPPARFRRLVDVLGTTGYIAKGLAIVIVGALFLIAAVQRDPAEAGGLDGALHSLTTVPGGVVALVAIAVGLMLYGVYCFARGAWSR
ncbi:DUF1206 domain-containing protein [Agrococcus sp. HG114]|uniref:DUF1206 domain-containing protein n=1 Tax=Agrococcus sp. HG114 TaxID=2969757 RepID=UPI00215A6CA1|nr:DUF1206 domain-containing protein [Agrococcus sp. HG114]MCR8671838.1 DUF1206 domain-containing protein [Agrococcus sp. HG114]